MKTLTLLRHAKSGWDDPVARDLDRPLNARGHRAAAVVGQYLRREGIGFDMVVASPAVRVSETLAALEAGYGAPFAPKVDRRLYLASAATLLDIVHALPDSADRALLVGHNPGLEDLVLDLAPAGELRGAVEEKYPTATLAVLRVAGNWRDFARGQVEFVGFIRPRDLDPALGPEE